MGYDGDLKKPSFLRWKDLLPNEEDDILGPLSFLNHIWQWLDTDNIADGAMNAKIKETAEQVVDSSESTGDRFQVHQGQRDNHGVRGPF